MLNKQIKPVLSVGAENKQWILQTRRSVVYKYMALK